MSKIILFIGIGMIANYIKMGLFSREYRLFDLIIGSVASLIFIAIIIIYGPDSFIEIVLPAPDFYKSDTFSYFIYEYFFKNPILFKIVYRVGVISCFLIPLCKLINNRYLNLSK